MAEAAQPTATPAPRRGAPTLTVQTPTRTFDVRLDGGPVLFGRGPENDVSLDVPTVSLHHALVRRRGERWEVVDLHSRNGTSMHGRPIEEALLEDGDTFELARAVRVAFHAVPAAPAADGEAPTLALPPEPEEATVDLAAARAAAASSSREPAREPEPSPEPAQPEPEEAAPGLRIEALHLGVKAGGRVLLRDISLQVEPRQFVAIVGMSGAGKTTLLNALSGFRPANSGEVLYDGVPLYRHFALLRSRIGYVPQDDIIHRELSVEKALRYSARLRMAARLSNKERYARVAEVIDELGLQGQRKTRVRNLSGGERKRVNLAVELLTRPPVLFLDEPTSGLDPGNETRMMSLFRQLADEGHTLLLVTHATRNISLCDKVLFLTSGGRLAFFGTPRNALRYFNVEDFEDIYLLLEGKRTPEEWEEAFRASRFYDEEVRSPLGALLEPAPSGEGDHEQPDKQQEEEPQLPPLPAPSPGPLRQFLILARRYAAILASDRKSLALLVLQAPVIAFLLWALFPRDIYAPLQGVTVLARQGSGFRPVQRDPQTGQLVNAPSPGDMIAVQGPDCTRVAQGQGGLSGNCQTMAGNGNNRALQAAQLAFALAAVAVWLGTLNAVREIAKEDAIYRRERLVSLRVAPYVASKFLVLTVVVVFQALLLLGVTALHVKFPMGYLHWLLPVHPQGRNLVIDLPTGAIDGVWLSIFLAMLASVALALAISAAITNPDRALLAAPLVMIPQFLFAGGLVPVHDLGPAQPLSFLVATRWGYEAIGRVTNAVRLAAIPPQFPYADQLQGSALGRWLVLVAFVLAFGVLAMGLQRLKDRR